MNTLGITGSPVPTKVYYLIDTLRGGANNGDVDVVECDLADCQGTKNKIILLSRSRWVLLDALLMENKNMIYFILSDRTNTNWGDMVIASCSLNVQANDACSLGETALTIHRREKATTNPVAGSGVTNRGFYYYTYSPPQATFFFDAKGNTVVQNPHQGYGYPIRNIPQLDLITSYKQNANGVMDAIVFEPTNPPGIESVINGGLHNQALKISGPTVYDSNLRNFITIYANWGSSSLDLEYKLKEKGKPVRIVYTDLQNALIGKNVFYVSPKQILVLTDYFSGRTEGVVTINCP
jgi:hypothetical protein